MGLNSNGSWVKLDKKLSVWEDGLSVPILLHEQLHLSLVLDARRASNFSRVCELVVGTCIAKLILSSRASLVEVLFDWANIWLRRDQRGELVRHNFGALFFLYGSELIDVFGGWLVLVKNNIWLLDSVLLTLPLISDILTFRWGYADLHF